MSSDQFFLVMSVGRVVLANAGDCPLRIRICAQRRMRHLSDAQRERQCCLEPRERRRLVFRGHWLLRVVAGNAASVRLRLRLRCLAAGTTGGDEADDELNMC